ncbi:MAG: glycine betaine ABC transporter substrate-binding protein [Pseudomonadota bacterium]
MSLRCLASVVSFLVCSAAFGQTVTIGSKNFTENYILAEIASQLLEARGYDVVRRQGLNGTKISFEALDNRAIDLYPEYSGTISEVILNRPELAGFEEIRDALRARDFDVLEPLGFNNAYALAVTEDFATTHSLMTVSDLKALPNLVVGVQHEFLSRSDGWPGLKAAYGLTYDANGMEHSLGYEAIVAGDIDVTAAYTTDGEIVRSRLRVLDDNLGYFPRYLAMFMLHEAVPADVRAEVALLSGRIDDQRMREMNLAALDPDTSIAEVASAFLVAEGLVDEGVSGPTFLPQLARNVQRHLKLTFIALGLAMVFGVGLAVIVYRHPLFSSLFLQFTGLLQTVPSIALLALLIPLVGVGEAPAIIALFLYSLLPIARNTITAIQAIPPGYRQVAAAMAMTRTQELRYVMLPLAMPHVIAGIRTAAVICIGTATLAAFIGAGGLGDPIVTGLALNDSRLILQGAIPAAALAITTEMFFSVVERLVVVPHMRSGRQT